MTTEDSLQHSMDSAVKHYSSMFSPAIIQEGITAIGVLCIGGVGFLTFVLFPSVDGLINCLLLGVSLFAITISFDYVTSKFSLRMTPFTF